MSKQILIVEDNHDDRVLISQIVGQVMKHQFVAVKDGIDAILAAQGQQFDLILVDLHLPNLQGWDIIKTLRDTERYANTPMIALTAYDHSAARIKATAAGCNLYLTKPIDIDKLVRAIATLLPSPF